MVYLFLFYGLCWDLGLWIMGVRYSISCIWSLDWC